MLGRILKQGNSQFLIFTDAEQTEENRVCETCNTHGEDELSTRKNYFENIKGKTTWDLDVSSKMIIKQILNIGWEKMQGIHMAQERLWIV